MRELQPGTAVTPSIRLVHRIGAGGMGSVWIAEHLALRTQVVVKFIAIELAASAEAVERFSREAAAAAQVKSPHVVQMLDHGVTTDGIVFIVMELLEGHDLGKHLATRGRLSIAETAEIVSQVCKALARAHERGIVHRDIKPDNIFLCAVGEGETFVKLLDFGIAKGDARLGGSSGTKTGAMVGTPYYMSPEQIVGAKTIDRRTDLWSLGIVAYECVVGARPFNEDVFGALAIRIHSGPLPVPSQVDPALPPAFDHWFARACARDANARFASARELGDALARVASGAPSEQRPSGATTPSTDVASHGWQPASTPGAASTPVTARTPPVFGGPALASAPALGPRPSTNPGLGVSTGAWKPAGRGVAIWSIAIAVGLVLVGIGGALAIKRIGTSAPALSAGSSVNLPSLPSPKASSAASAPEDATAQPSALSASPGSATATAPIATGTLDAASSRPSASRPPEPASPATAQPRPVLAGKPAQPRPSATPTATVPHEKDIF
jgi:serine/threonine-protein kinase